MEISNRSLKALVGVTALLVTAALLLTYTPDLGELAPAPPAPKAQKLRVMPVVTREGAVEIESTGPLKIRIEPGTDAASVTLACDVFRSERPIEMGNAVFPKVPGGGCSVLLKGTEKPFETVYAGDDITCLVVDRATECTGGLVSKHAARVTIDSELPAELVVDGDPYGPLPLNELRMRPGTRALRLRVSDLLTLEWSLVVKPEERIHVFFPAPPGFAAPVIEPTASQPEAEGSAG